MCIVLYDGDCHFCNFWVRFILARDRKKIFQFAPLSLKPDWPQTSIILVESGKTYRKSEAVFRVFQHLGWPEWLISGLQQIPLPIRDLVYDFIANRRYWISKVINWSSGEACPLPTPVERQRFIFQLKNLPLELRKIDQLR